MGVLWWGLKRLLVAVVVIVAVANVWAWADPPEPLRISAETTLITEPIAEDGLPDFAGALLDRLGRGVKPEDNGAIEFWQAIGPGEFDPELHALLFSAIGCAAPDPDLAMTPIRSGQSLANVVAWLSESRPDLDPKQINIQSEQLLHFARKRHGAVEAIPPLVSWFQENAKQLELFHDSASKPFFYSPPPNLLTVPPAPLVEALLPAEQGVREPAFGLATRAAWHIGMAEYNAAWRDLNTILVFGERFTSEPLITPQLVGVAIRAIAFEELNLLVDHCDDDVLLRQVIDRLNSLGDPDWIADAHGFGEPLTLIDNVVCSMYSTRPATELDLSKDRKAIEPNLLLGEIRRWQVRAARIANMPDRRSRRLAADAFERSLDEMADGLSSWTLLTTAFSRAAVNRSVARIHVALLTPAVVASFSAEDRSCAQQRLTLLIAALKLHQLQHGEYPETLDALTPEPLAEIPLDPFTNEPFRYERRDEGFAIWSLGHNGVDDGGSDRSGEFVAGDYAPIDWTGERPKPDGPDDVVVRLPVPRLELPGVVR
ncbi:hypothetical protein [Botrimarina colliarenosi]|uniref:hypothetical protein n=1 Tax=Botrimarina colliarenosi TaxID=2528001 RepID=UPI0011B6CE13|nr:hypothetical protein [Botrimarina colliarenosi]